MNFLAHHAIQLLSGSVVHVATKLEVGEAREPRGRWFDNRYLFCLLVLAVTACAKAQMPPPQQALENYLTAIDNADAEQLHAMMTRRAQVALSASEISDALEIDSKELRRRRDDMRAEQPQAEGDATLLLSGGRLVELSLSDQQFWLKSDGVVPHEPKTIQSAAFLFRDAVRARDYQRIRGLLSEAARKQFDEVFSALDSSMSNLDSAVYEVNQDRATIKTEDGLIIRLRRIEEIWKVEEVK